MRVYDCKQTLHRQVCEQLSHLNTGELLDSYLARFVVEPDKSMVSGKHFAVESGVILGRSAASHRPTDFDRFVQVDMALLKGVRVGPTGEDGECRRHMGLVTSLSQCEDGKLAFSYFLIQTDNVVQRLEIIKKKQQPRV